MTHAELTRIFRQEVPKPGVPEVQGDPWEYDATTADILRLIDTPPDELQARDFLGYLGYCTTGGDVDLRYLFPPILRIWEAELHRHGGVFVQDFHSEICRTDFVERALNERLRAAVTAFMVRALSERLAAETALRVHGCTTSHDWCGYVASFGVFSPALPTLWSQVWHSPQRGHAVALLQYLSCLLYDEDQGENPIFAPWTCDLGGGAPQLWDYESTGFNESWKPGNLQYLASALTSASIREWLVKTAQIHAGDEVSTIATQFLDHLADHTAEVDLRIELLLYALRTPTGGDLTSWSSLLDSWTRP